MKRSTVVVVLEQLSSFKDGFYVNNVFRVCYVVSELLAGPQKVLAGATNSAQKSAKMPVEADDGHSHGFQPQTKNGKPAGPMSLCAPTLAPRQSK